MARRRNTPVRPIRPVPPKGFDASAFQVRQAYERHYRESMPAAMTYADAGNRMVADLGHDAARALIQGESNNLDTPSPLARVEFAAGQWRMWRPADFPARPVCIGHYTPGSPYISISWSDETGRLETAYTACDRIGEIVAEPDPE